LNVLPWGLLEREVSIRLTIAQPSGCSGATIARPWAASDRGVQIQGHGCLVLSHLLLMSDCVTRWLDQLDLGDYATAFAENDIDLELLPDLDHESLIHLGVKSSGHRVRIMKAAQALHSGENSGGVSEKFAPEENESPASHGEAERRYPRTLAAKPSRHMQATSVRVTS